MVTQAAPSISHLISLPRLEYSALFTQSKQTVTEQYFLHVEMQEVAHFLGIPSVGPHALSEFRKVLSRFRVLGDGGDVMQMVEQCVQVLKDMSEPVRRAVGDALRDRSFLWSASGNDWTLHACSQRSIACDGAEARAELKVDQRLRNGRRQHQRKREFQKMKRAEARAKNK